jgi:hypothetical protein
MFDVYFDKKMSKMTKKQIFTPNVVEDDVLEGKCQRRKVAEWQNIKICSNMSNALSSAE